MSGVEVVEADTDFCFGKHMHDQYGIGVIDSGAQTSLSGRGVVEASAGDVITVNPGEIHDGAPIGDEGRSWRMLYFEPRIISELFSEMTDDRVAALDLSYPVLRDDSVAERFRTLFATVTGNGEPEQHRAFAEEQLFFLLEQMVDDKAKFERRQGVPSAIAKARSCIDEVPDRPFSLEDLAHICGLSRFQVLRGFVKDTGFTPRAYLIQRRLQLARRLIAQGLGLAEAALLSGFADQSHMTRLFVRTYGMSPGSYATALK